MGLLDHISSLRFLPYDALILLDEYRGSTTAFATNLAGGVMWISFGLTGFPGFAFTAIILHVGPPIPYYIKYGPFGIEFDYTPTKVEGGDRVPDKRAEQAGEAVLSGGQGTISARMNVSPRYDAFKIHFSTPDNVEVQLRDIPMSEHIYDRENNILQCSDISAYDFNLGLEIYGVSTRPGESYPLRIVDCLNDRTIETIDIVC